MATDNVSLPASSGKAASRDVTYSGESAHAQVVGLVTFAGSDDAKTVTDVTSSNPLPVTEVLPTAATGVVDALNETVTLALGSSAGAGFQATLTSLIGTLVPEYSLDGGTTWLTTNYVTAVNLVQQASVAVSGGGSFVLPSGATHVRLRLSAYTSGSASITISGSHAHTPYAVFDSLPAGSNKIGKVVLTDNTNDASISTNGSLYVAGAVAHDAGDSGAPVKVGARAISDLAGATMVAAGDRVDAMADLDGAQIVRPNAPLGNMLSERVSNTDGNSTAFSTFGATASTRNFVSSITVYNDSTTNGYLDIRDGTAGSVLLTIPLPAKGGAHIPFPMPLRQPTANTALAFDVSAALSTVYITVVGFKSKA